MKFKNMQEDKKYVLFLGIAPKDEPGSFVFNTTFLAKDRMSDNMETDTQCLDSPLGRHVALTPSEVKRGFKWLRKNWFAQESKSDWKVTKKMLKKNIYEYEKFESDLGVEI